MMLILFSLSLIGRTDQTGKNFIWQALRKLLSACAATDEVASVRGKIADRTQFIGLDASV